MKKLAFVLFSIFFATSASFAQTIGEKMPDAKGLVYELEDGQTLNLRIADHKLQLVFLDKDGLVEQTPFKRAVVRIDRIKANGGDLNFLMREDPSVPYMTHPRFIQPPLAFKVHILLYPDENDDEGKLSIPTRYFSWNDGQGPGPQPIEPEQ